MITVSVDCLNTRGCPLTPTTVTAGAPSTPPPANPGTDTNGAIDTCELLASPAFGSLTVVDGRAEYSCDEGYSLVGDATRECLNDLSWSGNAPTCELACKCKFDTARESSII